MPGLSRAGLRWPPTPTRRGNRLGLYRPPSAPVLGLIKETHDQGEASGCRYVLVRSSIRPLERAARGRRHVLCARSGTLSRPLDTPAGAGYSGRRRVLCASSGTLSRPLDTPAGAGYSGRRYLLCASPGTLSRPLDTPAGAGYSGRRRVLCAGSESPSRAPARIEGSGPAS